MPITDCGIIILAAGNSSRLGTPKQLLKFRNKTLLQHAVDEALALNAKDIVVVTGANHDNIFSSLSNKNIHSVYNENWQQGMASSMQAGLLALLAIHPDLSSVIILLCDQPYVSTQLLKDMIKQKEDTCKGIVACSYGETVGVPALFSNQYFDTLLSLRGSEGAKKIIMASKDDVAFVSFPLGSVDIDTIEDYQKLIK